MPANIDTIATALNQHFSQKHQLHSIEPVHGGDINTCFQCVWGHKPLFVKTNTQAIALSMLEQEHWALLQMQSTNTVNLPAPILVGGNQQYAFLVLERLNLNGTPNWQNCAVQLAAMHRVNHPQFGWEYDNFIGTTVQYNRRHNTWADFWWQQRLVPQLDLALVNGHRELARLKAPLENASQNILAHHNPVPSLVHGDLWSGNVGFLEGGTPTIFDPAAYFGDREVDIAMTQLFGGFPTVFYQAYNAAWALPQGFELRQQLYNLYHLLNHLNLFGGGYLASSLRTIETLIKTARY